MSRSSGKDCAFALHTVRTAGQVPITALLSTVHTGSDRVASHGVRRVLQAQAAALGLGLHVVELPTPCPNNVYEQAMGEAMTAARHAGADQLVFGDLFLADVRTYREQALHGTGITPVFPLWHQHTAGLAADMLVCRLRAVITCVDPAQAPAELAGRWYDEELLRELTAGVDPCGERGEFHTFVGDGPGFPTGLDVVVGEVTERDGFVFADVLPA